MNRYKSTLGTSVDNKNLGKAKETKENKKEEGIKARKEERERKRKREAGEV